MRSGHARRRWGPALLLLVLGASSTVSAQELPEEHQLRPVDVCGRRERPVAPPGTSKLEIKALQRQAQQEHRACAMAVIERRDRARQALRRGPNLTLHAGYDGALYVHEEPTRRYRSPSVLLGIGRRAYLHPRIGFQLTAAALLGGGIVGWNHEAVYDTRSKFMGVSYGALAEVGVVAGPWSRAPVYVSIAAQFRWAHAGRKPTGRRDIEGEPVREPGDVFGVGLRAGPGIELGKRLQYFLEASLGGGDVPGRRGRLFVTGSVRFGVALGR